MSQPLSLFSHILTALNSQNTSQNSQQVGCSKHKEQQKAMAYTS